MTAGPASPRSTSDETRTPFKVSRPHSTGEEISHAGARFFGRAGAIVLGLTLIVVGLGLGVTVVLLPAGIIVGLFGLLLFLAGLFGRAFQSREFERD